MLGSSWLAITVLLFLLAVLLRQPLLVLTGVLLLLVGAVSRLWARWSLERFGFQRRFSQTRALFGEEVSLDLVLDNHKPLPLVWVEVEDEVPEPVGFLKGRLLPTEQPGRKVLHTITSLGWYERVTWRYRLRCTQRGYFPFGPTRIRAGDPFGFYTQELRIEQPDFLMVYPKIVPLSDLGIPSRQFLGDIRMRSFLHEDPTRLGGVRQYVPGDNMKRIHWKATARTQQLQSKLYDSTTTTDLALFLDVRTVEPPMQGFVASLLELDAVVVASIANHAIEEGFRVGLYVNQNSYGTGRLIKLPPSQHQDQFMHVLEALAQIHSLEVLPIERLVRQESSTLSWVATVAVITAAPTIELLDTLAQLRKTGRKVALIYVGGDASRAALDGVPVFCVEDTVLWDTLPEVTLR